MKRISGFLRPHKHVSTDLGWSIEIIPDPDDPFRPTEVFVTSEQLEHAGIVPRLYRRISFVPRDLVATMKKLVVEQKDAARQV